MLKRYDIVSTQDLRVPLAKRGPECGMIPPAKAKANA